MPEDTRRKFPSSTSDRPSTHKTRSPIPPNQPAIAPHHPKPDRLFTQTNQRSPNSAKINYDQLR
ncbi:MAG: hypothetical protein M1G31_04900 [Pseudanabaena sp. Salubria-1]|nr:hypothetical protein [Pseudanabaena sp. Salubria-1]MCX5933797.1 hypothetical protein [Pseudanabaena sp. LacPavin_0818_WC45_MAG_42_6]